VEVENRIRTVNVVQEFDEVEKGLVQVHTLWAKPFPNDHNDLTTQSIRSTSVKATSPSHSAQILRSGSAENPGFPIT
jgi:hypothetical protein